MANVRKLPILAPTAQLAKAAGHVPRILHRHHLVLGPVGRKPGGVEQVARVGDRVRGREQVVAANVDQLVAVVAAAVATSVTTAAGIDDLRERLRDRLSVLAGPSGAGKSSLLMAVQPGLTLRVRRISGATGKGRHTTTAVRLRPLDVGGYVVDTPGIREFALWDLERGELQHCFREIADRFGQCQFRDCTHRHEPGCAVIAAVEAGEMDPGRYQSYRSIYESLPDPRDYSRSR